MSSPKTIGRYQVAGQIGEGSQGTVYLAEDPKLKRNVAIKMLDKNLITGQSAYIVFEYVEGELLSDYIKSNQPDLSEIIELMMGIAAGVAKAHQNGVVHRDLKPQNIILNEEGIPKIMDFGIAMMIEEGSTSHQVVGTPRYMAPEYVRQKVVTPGIDVFSLGAIFYELITGNPAFAGASTSEVLAKILVGPPQPPSRVNSIADDVIDGICLKALAANPRDRYQDAGKLYEVLKNYIKDNAQVASVDGHGKATLQFLYRRMQRKKDFPALAGSIRAINQLKSNSKEDAEKLAALIVNDFALTNKILKVVNSAYYGSFSGKISTISRAIVVLGVDQVRALAASLIFFEHMSNQAVAVKLKRLMASSLFRAIFSEQISEQAKIENTEEAFLCSMFYQLGQALVAYYLPDEDQDIERMRARGEKTETEITLQVMGVTFEEVGAFIARQWNFPTTIVNNIKKPEPGKPQKANSPDEKYRLITYMSEEATKALADGGSQEDVENVLKRYSEVLPVKPGMAEGVMALVRENFGRMSQTLLKEKNLDNKIANLQGRQTEAIKPRQESQACRARCRGHSQSRITGSDQHPFGFR
ncbi:MAG: HDOD domain-containing protein [Gammaproteobacteria bacterium]